MQRPFIWQMFLLLELVTSFFIKDTFQESSPLGEWKPSQSNDYTGNWVIKASKSLMMETPNAFHGIAAKFRSPLNITDRNFAIEFAVSAATDNVTCSGAYVKLFGNEDFEPEQMKRNDPYLLMFGPDQCGENSKVKMIIQRQNPRTGMFHEKAIVDAPLTVLNRNTTIYRLVIHTNNKFEILIDNKPAFFGNLLKDLDPPVNPPREIDDPSDTKPSDWVDDEYIEDPTAKKPDDWDETQPEFIPNPEKLNPPDGWLLYEPKEIPNPDAVKPDDWIDEIHGEWEPELVPNPKCESAPGCGEYEPPLTVNPKYVGPWEPPHYRNPMYRGPWRPRRIRNPDYYEDRNPHNVGVFYGIGFDLWTDDGSIEFSNLSITDDLSRLSQKQPLFVREQTPQRKSDVKIDLESLKIPHQPKKTPKPGIVDTWKEYYNTNKTTTLCVTVVAIILPLIMSICMLKH